MKIAIIHDYLNQYGGAERVIEALHEVFPEAPIYTSIYLPQNLPPGFKQMDIRTSFMQRLPSLDKNFKKYFMIYPFAFRSLNLSGYDVILSSTTGYAKGIRVPKGALHISYCNTPARFIWRYEQYIEKEQINKVNKAVTRFLTSLFKKWDINTARKVDYFIANSINIQNRIKSIYNKDSQVIYPPVETDKFSIPREIDDYYLVVSRLNAYKRVDLVIEAFNRLKLPLRIIGDGPYRKVLAESAGPTIRFLGRLAESDLAYNYSRCRALIFPAEEDFGIVPLEAQSCGRPVIAYAAGGALETVIDLKTGIFFHEQSADSLAKAITKFITLEPTFNPQVIRENALRFDKPVFKDKIRNFILQKYQQFKRA